MSNTKFTKGVWDWSHDECTSSMIEIKSDMGCSICRLQSEDNAQLIAEAPELYRMLSDFKDFAVRQGWNHVLINDAEKLLAKVRGES